MSHDPIEKELNLLDENCFFDGGLQYKLILNIFLNLFFIEIVTGGLSHGEVPGVIFTNDKTWIESRRTSLHILRDFGYGKNSMKEMIDDEVNNFEFV